MTTLPPQQAERVALCDLFLEVGPDAPTLCEGWTTYDLATHLVIRERKPLSGPGLVMGGAAARMTARILARTKAQHSYADLVARVRSGPPLVLKPFDKAMNLTEYFVHHEDVRRGGGDNTPRPGAEGARIEDALWQMLQRGAKFMTRPVKGIGLLLVRPGGDVVHARTGAPAATITGTAGEIVLFLSGREKAAEVELGGDPRAVEILGGAGFGV